MGLTPEQFDKIATKDDLINLEKRLYEKFATKFDINRIMTVLDGIAKNQENLSHELTSNQAAHDRFEMDIEKLKNEAVKVI